MCRLEDRVEALQVVVGGGNFLEIDPCLLCNLLSASKRPASDHRHPRPLKVREVVAGEL